MPKKRTKVGLGRRMEAAAEDWRKKNLEGIKELKESPAPYEPDRQARTQRIRFLAKALGASGVARRNQKNT